MNYFEKTASNISYANFPEALMHWSSKHHPERPNGQGTRQKYVHCILSVDFFCSVYLGETGLAIALMRNTKKTNHSQRKYLFLMIRHITASFFPFKWYSQNDNVNEFQSLSGLTGFFLQLAANSALFI